MIISQLSTQITTLRELLNSLTEEQYIQKINFLGDSSIGAHSRHVIELIKCLINGYKFGRVDYINRERNLLIEQRKTVAIMEINMIIDELNQVDKKIILLTESKENEKSILVKTTYFREIEYNKEHTIHHLALIKVALREMNLNLVNDSFGVAHSTLKYLAKQKQIHS